MKTINYNPFGNSAVIVRFNCDECSSIVISDAIGIPNINFSAETDGESYNDHTELINCEYCLKEFKIKVWDSSVGGYIEVDIKDHRKNSICVTEIEEERDLFDDELNELDTEFLRELKEVMVFES